MRVWRRCSRELARLQHCPLCVGLINPPVCRGSCLVRMKSCTHDLLTLNTTWVDYIGKACCRNRASSRPACVFWFVVRYVKMARTLTSSTRVNNSYNVGGGNLFIVPSSCIDMSCRIPTCHHFFYNWLLPIKLCVSCIKCKLVILHRCKRSKFEVKFRKFYFRLKVDRLPTCSLESDLSLRKLVFEPIYLVC